MRRHTRVTASKYSAIQTLSWCEVALPYARLGGPEGSQELSAFGNPCHVRPRRSRHPDERDRTSLPHIRLSSRRLVRLGLGPTAPKLASDAWHFRGLPQTQTD